jgi:hypothetical protein
MQRAVIPLAAGAVLGLAELTVPPVAEAGFLLTDFMNPSRWFGNNYDRGYYGGGPWGGYGPYGWGGGPWGGYGPYGWGGGPWRGYGWGGPWGGWGYPGYGPGGTIVVNTPGGSSGSSDARTPAPRLPE